MLFVKTDREVPDVDTEGNRSCLMWLSALPSSMVLFHDEHSPGLQQSVSAKRWNLRSFKNWSGGKSVISDRKFWKRTQTSAEPPNMCSIWLLGPLVSLDVTGLCIFSWDFVRGTERNASSLPLKFRSGCSLIVLLLWTFPPLQDQLMQEWTSTSYHIIGDCAFRIWVQFLHVYQIERT